MLLNYVDDQIYFGSLENLQNWFKKKMRERFQIEEKGPPNWFISSKITRINKDYILDQHRFCLNLLTQFQPPNSTWGIQKLRDTPLPAGTHMFKTWEPQNQKDYEDIDSKYNDFDYRSCVGALIYLSGGTR